MTWHEFELLIGEAFRRRGYRVLETGGRGADGGIDLILARGSERFFVQCKQWKAFRVGVTTIRELYGVIAAEGAAGGFVVTSGRFTREAERFANGRNVTLLDGAALQHMVLEAKTAASTLRTPTAPRAAACMAPTTARIEPVGPLETPSAAELAAPAKNAPRDPVICPRCAKPMVLRVARRGASAGQSFWGCSAFAEGCRGVRPI